MEEDISKFPIKKKDKKRRRKKKKKKERKKATKKEKKKRETKWKKRKRATLKRQLKCHVFAKQVCFSYGESLRTPPLEGTSLHRRSFSVERPWGILSQLTTCLTLWVKSSHQSHCHVSPTQELRACILTRQCSPARKNRTRKKKSMVEDAWKTPEKIRKISPQNSWNQQNH